MKIKNAVLFSLLYLIFNSSVLANSDPKTDVGIQFHTSKTDLGLKSNLGKEFENRYFIGANRNNKVGASIFLRHIRPINEWLFWGIEFRAEDTRQKFKRKGSQQMVGTHIFTHQRGITYGVHGIIGTELGAYRFYGHSGMVGTPSRIKLYTSRPYGHKTYKCEEVLWGISKGVGFDVAINNSWRVGLQYAHINHESQKLRAYESNAYIHSKSELHSLGFRLSSQF